VVGDAPVNAAPALLLTPAPNETWKVYYYAGAQLIAMREITSTGNTLYYLHSDHLGSTSVTTDASGNVLARQNYYPYGGVRASTGTLPTDIMFTGQRADATGLYFYNARYYSSTLGRFVSADSIVPELGNPQALNRYAYVFNNPLKYVDPTGHMGTIPLRPNTARCGPDGIYCGGIGNEDSPVPNLAPPITPPFQPPFGSSFQLLAPGNGGVSYYTYPIVNNPAILHPEQLNQKNSGHPYSYYTRQGSVRLNDTNWNYWCLDKDCTSGEWRPSSLSCAYASATQCLTPLENRSQGSLTSGAVAVPEDGGQIPIGQSQIVLIYAPEADRGSPFRRGLFVNTRDACPACTPLQVDVLSLYGFKPINTKGGIVTPVYIWLVIPTPQVTLDTRPRSGPY